MLYGVSARLCLCLAMQSCTMLMNLPHYNNINDFEEDVPSGFHGGSGEGINVNSSGITLSSTSNARNHSAEWTPQWDQLVAIWNFETVSENRVTETTNGVHNALIENIPASYLEPGRVGNRAMNFDGANDRLVVDGHTDFHLSSGLSLSTWIYPTQAGPANRAFIAGLNWPDEGPFCCSGPYNLRFDNTNRVIFNVYDTNSDMNYVNIASAPLKLMKWHHILATFDGTTSILYINGQEVARLVRAKNPDYLIYGGDFTIGAISYDQLPEDRMFTGAIDEVALWSGALSPDEINQIYQNQSPRFTGVFTSAVLESSDNNNWTSLEWATPIPFFKELPSGGGSINSETNDDYTSISSNLMNGSLAMFHFNGEYGAIANSSTIVNDAGNVDANTVDANSSLSYANGIFAQSLNFNGDPGDRVDLNSDLNLSGLNAFTFSGWVRIDSLASHITLFTSEDLSDSFRLMLRVTDDGALQIYKNTGVLEIKQSLAGLVPTHKWVHVAYALNTNLAAPLDGKMYLNGVLVENSTQDDALTDLESGVVNTYLGGRTSGQDPFTGYLDEVGIWGRDLSDLEILQLYQRGANRVKFQVRSCLEANCSDQDVLDFGGWKGPGGNQSTFFTELYNNTDIQSICAVSQECKESELKLMGDVKTTSPKIDFDSFGLYGLNLPQNRFLQFRTILESHDDSNACSNSLACMPTLQSVRVQ
jgi:trimeric autotransporter adhesin